MDNKIIGRPEDFDVAPGMDEVSREFLSKKTGVMVAVPNLGGLMSTPLGMWLISLCYQTIDAQCPYFFKLHLPTDLTPIEYARNECVREFLKDPFYKKLWFIDSDMIPPGNAFDLLAGDEDMVSGMTYIWNSQSMNSAGEYVPPKMKINAFDFRPGHEDFISKIPNPDNRAFYCDAAGAACMVIKRELLENMPEPWFRTIRDPYGAGLRGEDLDFCKRAKDLMGTKVLYMPRVQFGHMKRLDLSEVTKYGLVSMRNVIDQVKKTDPDKIKALLPDITFAGEKRAVDDSVPQDFKIVQGGKA